MQDGCWLWPHPWCSRATGWAGATCLYALLWAVLWLDSPWPEQTVIRAKEGQWWSCQSLSRVSAPCQGIIYPLKFMGMTGSFKRKAPALSPCPDSLGPVKHMYPAGMSGTNPAYKQACRVCIQSPSPPKSICPHTIQREEGERTQSSVTFHAYKKSH